MAVSRKRNVEIDVLVDDKKARAQLKGIGDSATQTGQGFSRLGGAMAVAGAAIAAGAVVAVRALERIERIGAQTDAAIESTGGVANVTREHIEGLAGSLEALTSVEAESIQEGQNLLLTFTKVRNEVGEGNDIFDQATEAALNMSVAMGTEMTSASIMLGKALNDPVKGLNAMTRAGIQFTAEQKKMIVDLVEAGDTMEAQKIILAELTTQFGGSAEALGETLTGRIDKVKHSFGEMTEGLMIATLPTIERVVTGLGIMAIAFGEITGQFSRAEMAIKQYELEAGKTADTAAELVGIWKEYNVSAFELLDTMDLSTEELIRLRNANEEYLKSIGWTVEGIEKMDAATADLIVSHQNAARDAGRHSAAGRDLADATDEATGAIDGAADATQNLADQMLAAADPSFALFQAQNKVAKAQRDYNTAVDDFGPKSQEAADAAVVLAEAHGRAEAAASKFAEEGGPQSTDALADMLAQAGVLPEVIQRIIDQIGRLNNTPVTNRFVRDKGNIVGGDGVAGFRQHGGPVMSHQSYVVGEGGPELFVPNVGGKIVPNGTRMNGSGGTTNYYVTVQTLDARAAGRVVLEALQELNRVNGPLPLTIRSA